MRKVLCAVVLLMIFGSSAFGFSSSELKMMSIFISNFTETVVDNFDVNDISDGELIKFGIWHNYINNYRSRVQQCNVKNCKYGSLMIDKKYVDDSVKKFFNMSIRKHQTIGEGNWIQYYDGRKYYHFEGADGESIQAKVFEAYNRGGVIVMKGKTYYADHEDLGYEKSFTATAKPYKYNGKNTWQILSLHVED